ncbi:MAG: hypothetical protein ACRD0J_09310, partial [Acidimicrobiales bacterium]
EEVARPMRRTAIRRYLIRRPTPLAVTALALAGVAASSGVAGAAPTSTAAGAGGAGAGAPSRAGPGHQAASRHRGPGPLPTPGLGVDLGPNVYVFDPAMPESRIQATVDAIADQQVPNQFGSQRYALLFEPGTYGSAAHPLVSRSATTPRWPDWAPRPET